MIYGEDTLTWNGADKLRRKIEAYWRKRGREVELKLVEDKVKGTPLNVWTIICIRSNMVNGRP